MEQFWDFFSQLFHPQSIIKLGLPLILFVIFAETGLFVGFFLPGDNLVFLSGLFCATHPEWIGVDIYTLLGSMIIAAIIGNMTGYWFGKKMGRKLFEKEDSLLFKKKHLIATENYYQQHGGKTLLMGRFIPVIRTFAPIFAGIILMDYKKFSFYNISGAIAWIGGIGGIGYFLGVKFPAIEKYIGYIVISLIVITIIPVILTLGKASKNKNKQ